MFILGHIATGVLVVTVPTLAQDRALQPYRQLLPAVLGTLTPDIIDKTLLFSDLIAPSRSLGHSLFFWLPFLLLAIPLFWRQRSLTPYLWWLLGGLSHFLTDLINDALRGLLATGTLFTSWMLWPAAEPGTLSFSIPIKERISLIITPLEVTVILLALLSLLLLGRRRRGQAKAEPPENNE